MRGIWSKPGRPHSYVLRNHSVGKQVQAGRLRTAVGHGDNHAQVRRRRLRIVDRDRPVPVLVEDAGVDQLVLGLVPATPAVLLAQPLVRVLLLRVVVAPAHPGVGRRGVQVPPVLLDVLAVVALVAAEPEQALLQDRVLAVPQSQGEAERLPVVTDPGEAVLVPPVDPGPGMVVREVLPRCPVLAVVLADRAPGALGQVGSPLPPRPLALVRLPEADQLSVAAIPHGGNCG
jgi:hypothetical protein